MYGDHDDYREYLHLCDQEGVPIVTYRENWFPHYLRLKGVDNYIRKKQSERKVDFIRRINDMLLRAPYPIVEKIYELLKSHYGDKHNERPQ